ncbi:MAG: hypothetical protein ACOC10_10095 [Bacteroidota bacterium]
MTAYKGKVVKGVGWPLMERFGRWGMAFFYSHGPFVDTIGLWIDRNETSMEL